MVTVVIVVATDNFEVYYDAVNALRDRNLTFSTITPSEEIPSDATVIICGVTDEIDTPNGVDVVRTTPDTIREAVDNVLSLMRTTGGRTIVGVDPGARPGIAVLVGDVIVAAHSVPLVAAVDVITEEIQNAVDPIVRIGDGARLQGAQIINALEGVRIELVDETGTTPFLGSGTRGMGDVLAAVNIARREGDVVEHRTVNPTSGELQVIKRRSRDQSPENREIPTRLARRVATGDLTINEALEEHRSTE